MLGFPDLTPTAMAKLAELADLEKRGAAWEDEPRLPAGQSGGGQWTTGGDGGGGAAASANPVRVMLPAATVDSVRPAAHVPSEQSAVTLTDGVYRPEGKDVPLTATAIEQLPGPLLGVPEDLTPLEESLIQQYLKTGEVAGPKPGLPPEGLKPPTDGPLIEGTPSRSSEAAKGGRSLYDPKGGEWRWDSGGDPFHNRHWDYKPPGSPNNGWQNIPWGGLTHLKA